MTEAPKLDKFSGHLANSHSLTLKLTGLSSDDAIALASAFSKILKPLSEEYNHVDSGGDKTLSIGDASKHVDKIVAALATAIPAAKAAEVSHAAPAK